MKTLLSSLTLSLASLTCASAYAVGSTNPAVTQDNISRTICTSGYTATIRPSVTYTNSIKKAELLAKGLSWKDAPQYELDHIVPLEVGGHPSHIENLAIQSWVGASGAHVKDALETRVKKLVCAGKISLVEGQQCFLAGWETCKY